jgi:hypothetical protein
VPLTSVETRGLMPGDRDAFAPHWGQAQQQEEGPRDGS